MAEGVSSKETVNKEYMGQHMRIIQYSKTCVKRPLKNRQNTDLNDKWFCFLFVCLI